MAIVIPKLYLMHKFLISSLFFVHGFRILFVMIFFSITSQVAFGLEVNLNIQAPNGGQLFVGSQNYVIAITKVNRVPGEVGHWQTTAFGSSANSTQVSITIDDDVNGLYTIRHSSAVSTEDVFKWGYYTGVNSSYFESDATQLTYTELSSPVDFILLGSAESRGDFLRPDNTSATDPITVNISVDLLGLNGEVRDSLTFLPITMPSDATSWGWHGTLPRMPNISYRIRYSCIECSDILPQGYYNSEGSGFLSSEAELLGSDDFGVTVRHQLPLLGGQALASSIAAPNNISVASELTVGVKISWLDQGLNELGNAITWSSIATGGVQSADFNVTVPARSDLKYRISVVCRDCPNVLAEAWLEESGLSFSDQAARVFTLAEIPESMSFELLPGNQIEGSITRINYSFISPDSQISLITELLDAQGNVLNQYRTTVVTFVQNQLFRTLDYSVSAPINSGGYYRISYECDFGCAISGNNTVAPRAYYNTAGTVISSSNAELLSSDTNHSNIDLVQLAGNIRQLLLEISRPATSDINQALELVLLVRNASNINNSLVRYPTLDAGQPTRTLLVEIPFAQFHLSYICRDCIGVLENAYMTDSPSTYLLADAIVFDASTLNEQINFQMTGGNTLEVSLSRPVGVPTDQELKPNVQLIASTSDGDITDVFNFYPTIEVGETTESFLTTLPLVLEQATLVVFCSADINCPNVFTNHYFTPNGASILPSERQYIAIAPGAITKLNMTLAEGIDISGTIQRPPLASHAQELSVTINADIVDDAGNTVRIRGDRLIPDFLTIDAGESETAFSLRAPVVNEGGFRLSYFCENCEDIFQIGYYNGTLYPGPSQLFQFVIPAQSVLEGLRFRMLEQLSVNGVLTRPADVDGTINNINLRIGSAGQQVNLPLGVNEVAFSIPVVVTSDTLETMSYQCTGCSIVHYEGFYDGTITQADPQAAAPLPVLQARQGVNLSLIKSNSIAGVFSRPAEPVFQTLVIDLEAEAVRADGSTYGKTTQRIRFQNFSEAENYQLAVPSVLSDGVRLKYTCVEPLPFCFKIIFSGFYAANGTQILAENALILNTESNLTEINWGVLPDTDGDGVTNENDNCPINSNFMQSDLDMDGIGDACDPDIDGDNSDATTGDIDQFNRFICHDLDNDRCDDCSSGTNDPLNDGTDTDGDGICDAINEDQDQDDIPDIGDNCPALYNPDQSDQDNDGIGDACDSDEEEMCFPIRSRNAGLAIICL